MPFQTLTQTVYKAKWSSRVWYYQASRSSLFL